MVVYMLEQRSTYRRCRFWQKKIIFSDEANFDFGGYVNKQNCHIWVTKNFHAYIKKSTPNDRFLRSFPWQFYLLSAFLPEICWEEVAEEIFIYTDDIDLHKFLKTLKNCIQRRTIHISLYTSINYFSIINKKKRKEDLKCQNGKVYMEISQLKGLYITFKINYYSGISKQKKWLYLTNIYHFLSKVYLRIIISESLYTYTLQLYMHTYVYLHMYIHIPCQDHKQT